MAAGAVAVADERDGRNHGQQCEANRLLIHLPVSAKISHSLSPFFMAGDDVIHQSVEFEIFDTTRIRTIVKGVECCRRLHERKIKTESLPTNGEIFTETRLL